MNEIITIMAITSIFNVISLHIDKHLLNIGINRKDYFYYMCLSMIPFALITLVIEIVFGNFKFSCNIIPFLLLMLSMCFRYYKQLAHAGTTKKLEPYENLAYMSLGIILAFIIDILLKIRTFNCINIVAIILTLVGVFCLSNKNINDSRLKKELVIRIIGNVILGFIANIVLRYWSNAIYILLLNLFLTLYFSRDYTINYHKNRKKIIKWVFIQQIFGFIYTYLFNYLSSISITTSNFVTPITIMISFILTLFLKEIKTKPKLKDFISLILISLGVLLINMV